MNYFPFGYSAFFAFQACDDTGELTACVPLSSTSSCSCSRSICDYYDPTSVAKCYNNTIYEIESCNSEACIPSSCGASCTATASDWIPEPPSCSSAFKCNSDGFPVDVQVCLADQYVDEDGKCQQFPPVPCSSSCSGYCADYTDCTRYYICDGTGSGIPSAGPFDCVANFYFNPHNTGPICSGTTMEVCSPLTLCDFDTTSQSTTPAVTPSPCSDSGVGVPCNADNAGNYEYAECDQR